MRLPSFEGMFAPFYFNLNYYLKKTVFYICFPNYLSQLCGLQLDTFFTNQGKDDVKNVLKKLSDMTNSDSDVTGHICEMAQNIVKLATTGWSDQPKATTTSNIKNPYQNNGRIPENLPANAGYYDSYNSNYPIQEMYACPMCFCSNRVNFSLVLGMTLAGMNSTRKFVMILKIFSATYHLTVLKSHNLTTKLNHCND